MLKEKLIKLEVSSPDYDLSHIGGKANGLSVIHRMSLLTPQTWVVTTGLFAAFKEKIRDLLIDDAVIIPANLKVAGVGVG